MTQEQLRATVAAGYATLTIGGNLERDRNSFIDTWGCRADDGPAPTYNRFSRGCPDPIAALIVHDLDKTRTALDFIGAIEAAASSLQSIAAYVRRHRTGLCAPCHGTGRRANFDCDVCGGTGEEPPQVADAWARSSPTLKRAADGRRLLEISGAPESAEERASASLRRHMGQYPCANPRCVCLATSPHAYCSPDCAREARLATYSRWRSPLVEPMPVRRKRIYVCGPYSGNEVRNVECALQSGVEVVRRGHNPFVPHLSHYLDLAARSTGLELSWAQWMDLVTEWLCVCDALLFLAPSPGANIELDIATRRGLVVYRCVDDIPIVPMSARAVSGTLGEEADG